MGVLRALVILFGAEYVRVIGEERQGQMELPLTDRRCNSGAIMRRLERSEVIAARFRLNDDSVVCDWQNAHLLPQVSLVSAAMGAKIISGSQAASGG